MMATKGWLLRGLMRWSMLANISLPTPDSPVNSTVAAVGATRCSMWQAALKADEAPTMVAWAEGSVALPAWLDAAALPCGIPR
ncbi:hypothetical protein D3C87_1826220 [compost metagenome]